MPAKTWQDELRQALRHPDELRAFFGDQIPRTPYPAMIPLKLARKIRMAGPASALWKQFIPHPQEALPGPGLTDPTGDHRHAVAGRLIHRYPNRVLFLPTTTCPVHCRYCFRKNELAKPDELFKGEFQAVLSYLQSHPEIEEIIYSGGDPLILSTDKLADSLMSFASLASVKYIRWHSRVPVILPSRFEDTSLEELFAKAAKRFRLLSLTVHLNHPEEIDSAVTTLFRKLARWPVRLLTQSVLLAGINDRVDILKELFLQIAALGATPYYLHHPDPVRGAEHFCLPLSAGRQLQRQLRRQMPAQALPHYVVERPLGAGKRLAMEGIQD